ncbi:unnamed protein product [Durusdinium trenchii]|uniref:Uncharacterized protein n=1 Tax=Durusdinium trenchii TaxID=1381693 RepID=A0ABP0MAK4_9DINO
MTILGKSDDGWPDEPKLQSGPPVPIYSIILAVVWVLPVLLYWGLDFILTRRRRIVEEAMSLSASQQSIQRTESELSNVHTNRHLTDNLSVRDVEGDHFPVMLASLEHSLPHLAKARATAGGLGKVVDLISRKHPTDILLVHPMLEEVSGQVEYGKACDEDPPLRLVVEGVRHDVQVFRYKSQDTNQQPHVEFLMLAHPLFKARTLDSIYPNPMSRKAVLTFFSLWNQAVGALLVRHKPHVFHCPDFHSAVAPWYAINGHPSLKVLLVLHNAEYQGTISTDMILGRRLETLAYVFNLPKHIVAEHLLLDGRFNMLKSAVDFICSRQNGFGACAVSHWYAAECHSAYSVLWELPVVHGLDNPMLEEERVHLEGDLASVKADAKKRIQQRLGLEVNPNARLFVSLGRLVRQKGVDLIADVADWLLSNFADAQLILVGPVGDGFGHYAATKLEAMKENGRHAGRLHVHIQFMRDKDVLKDMKLGADFCLMPSRDEPFGYVDIEFAWHGALLVGAQAGGLGKVPGFYFLAQNRENLDRLRRELRTAVTRAMKADLDQLHRMAEEAISCTFPLDVWQRRLRSAYLMVVAQGAEGTWQEETVAAASDRRTASESEGDLDIVIRAPPGPPGASIEFSDASPASRKRASTFQPFLETHGIPPPRPPPSEQPAGETAPVSLVDLAVGHQGEAPNRSFSVSAGGPEFLTQELDEAELAERIKKKVQLHDSWGIDEILVSVGEDVDFEREGSSTSRWLLMRTCGVQRIHIVVALGYVASPVAEFLTFVTATEWGLRGGESVPRYAQRLLGTQIDPPILNMVLFGFNALAFAISAPLWAALSRYLEPRKVMALCLMLQVPLLITLWPFYPKVEMALFLIFVHGMVTSASFLFLVFNFMMSIKADMSQYAVRLGALEMLQYVVNWLLTGYIFLASPSSLRGTKETPLTTGFSLLLLPVGLLMILLTAVPAVLLLFAPGPYRNDRFPGWNLELFHHKRSFVLLLVSDCFGSLALFPGTCYITWWLSNGWSSQELSGLSVLFAFLLAAGTFLWAATLSYTSVHGFSFLIGVAVMLAPATMLRDLVQEEVATITSLGRSQAALIVSVLSLFLEGVRSSAMWTAKIRILNSRWRLLSYGTILQSCSHFCAFLSPIVCEILARMNGVTFITRNQKELADAMIVSGLPLGLLQFFFQVSVAPFIKKDMGVSVGAERTRSLQHRLRKGTSVFAFSTLVGISVLLVSLTFLFLKIELGVDRIARCVQPRRVNCTVIVDELDPEPAILGWHYGPNRFGQNTTGLYNCMQRMQAVGGSFMRFQ